MIKIIKKFNSPYHFGREEKVEFMYEFQAWFILLESTYNVVNVHIYDTTKYTTNSKSSLHTKIQAKLVQQYKHKKIHSWKRLKRKRHGTRKGKFLDEMNDSFILPP